MAGPIKESTHNYEENNRESMLVGINIIFETNIKSIPLNVVSSA